MKIRCSLVGDIVTTKVRAVIGWYGFLLRPMAKRAFYKLLRVQEVDSPPQCERTQQGIFKYPENAWKTKTFGINCIRKALLDAQK